MRLTKRERKLIEAKRRYIAHYRTQLRYAINVLKTVQRELAMFSRMK
jgi:hypothetical protein